MVHPTEHTIERFILARDQGAAEFAHVREHIAECPACQGVAEFLRKIYAALASASPEPGERVNAFVDSLFPRARVLHLRRFEQMRPAHPAPNRPFLLAAHTPSESLRFRTTATLLSEDESALIRIVHDSAENVNRLSLQTEDSSIGELAIVEIPLWQITCVTDSRGEAVLKQEIPPGGPQPPAAIVYPALSVFDVEIDLSTREVKRTGLRGDPGGVQLTLAEHTFEIAASSPNRISGIGRLLVIGPGTPPQLHSLSTGPVRIPVSESETAFRVALYS